MRHPTYKHLEAKLRLGPFSVGQWVQIMSAGVTAALFGVYVSPLPASATIFVSVVGAGLPVAISYGAMGLEFSVGRFAKAAWQYWRKPRAFLPGAGDLATGYTVCRPLDPSEVAASADTKQVAKEEPLWDL